MAFWRGRDIYSSKTASEITSETIGVADIDENISVQLVGSPSTTTLQGSNDSGVEAVPTNWSTISTVIGAQLITVEPGFRWLRALRSETTNVVVAGWFKTHK